MGYSIRIKHLTKLPCGATWKIEKLSDSRFAIWMPVQNSETGYRLYAYKGSIQEATQTLNAAKVEF